jgi:hypothetical protein
MLESVKEDENELGPENADFRYPQWVTLCYLLGRDAPASWVIPSFPNRSKIAE